jgi:hypothetical protein
VFEFLKLWLGRSRPQVATRLTEREALAIAREAAAGDPLCEQLAMTLVEERAEGLVWIVGSAGVGFWLQVTIDDTSGRVLEIKHGGLR